MTDQDNLHAIMAELVTALAVTTAAKSISEATGVNLQPASLIPENSISLAEYHAYKQANIALKATERQDAYVTVCDGFVSLSQR